VKKFAEKNLPKAEMAKEVGKLLAEKAKEAGVEKVVFDRNGYLYHGRVKSLAEGAREGGLNSKTMTNANVKKVKSSEIEFKDRLVSIQRVTK
jgi:hypothetical protein